MTSKRNKAVPAVYVMLRNDHRILLVRRAKTGYFDGFYSLPAGHVETGELPLDALVREAREEIGVTIRKKDARLMHTMYRTAHDKTGDRADYFFEVRQWEGNLSNMEPTKCDDVRWFSLSELPSKTVPCVREAIKLINKGIGYSELDKDFLVKTPKKS